MDIKLKPLEEQVVVIIGASSSIGLATALSASLRGAKLVLAADDGDLLDTIVDKINSAGGEAIGVRTDHGKRESLEALARMALRRFGRIDTWVNDTGLVTDAPAAPACSDEARALSDTHFWSVVNGSLIALRHLKATGGAIINLGVDASGLPARSGASNDAAKAFHDALRTEADDTVGAPISVTFVQPSATSAEPEQVADAILGSAIKPTRYAKVGPSKIDSLLRALATSANDATRYGRAHAQHRPGKTFH